MAVQRSTHPSADTLKAFGLGKLDDSSSGMVMDHLDQCDECRQKVTALSGDDFLQRLRQAHSHSSTPAPAKSLAEIVQAEKSPTSRTPIPNLPPELANNPHYEILRELGRGGMGVVYLAHNKLMDRLEVLKVVNKAHLDHPGAVERFLREIRAAAKLSHANVVAAYSAVQQGELLAFAMEYVEGQDLASLVKSQGPLPVANACFYVQQAALGLQHAYEKQMVHRDIKPQNLILAREGKKHLVKVLDFGLAKVMREKTDDTGLTGEGRMLGTPDYIAPEQTLDAAKADIRADIYSLGCTLYFLLSGRAPFSANSLGAILLAHQMQEAKTLNLVRPEVPQELAAVVRKMMAKSPVQRYQTPREVAQALAPFIKPGAAPKSSAELSSGTPEAKPIVKKTARLDPPPAPVVEEADPQPETVDVEASPPKGGIPPVEARRSGRFSDVTIGSALGQNIPNVAPPKRRTVHKRQRAAGLPQTRKKWLIGGGLGVGVLLLVLFGIWASSVLRVKTKEGILVLEDVPADAEVTVDGERVIFDPGDGKPVEVLVAAGEKKVQVKKEGFKVFGERVEIDAGGRHPIRVRLEPLSVPAPDVAPDAVFDADRRAAEWVLSRGGTIRVRVTGKEEEILAVGNLPVERFQLLTIKLDSKPVGDEGLANLKGLTHLTVLLLWGARISDAGLAHLKDLTSLRELLLFRNPKVTDAGLVQLKRLANLRNLDLNATGVTDAGLVHLKGLTNLTGLNLMSTRLSGAGFVHLETLTNLTGLYLANSQVVDSELAHLARLSNLQSLGLDGTRITDAGLVHLQGLKRLGVLHLTRGKVTNAGVAALRKALPDCRIHVHGNPAAAPAGKPAAQKADYDALATGRWVPILTASGESVASKDAAFKDNVLEVKNSGIAVDRAVQAKDMIVRAKVKKVEGQIVGLVARQDTSNPLDGNRYAAWLIDNGRFGIGKRENQKWISLLQQAVPEGAKIKDGEFFEFALAVVGDRLTVYINGKRVLETRDPAVLPGSGAAGIGTVKCVGQFKDIEV
jgi:serine/threonine protein kinase